jgi:hypothetical protein
MRHAIGVILLLVVGSAQAATVHFDDFIIDANRTNFNGFEGMAESGNYPGTSQPYTEDGITVQQPQGQDDIWNYCSCGTVDGLRSWYSNGGDYGYTMITRSNGSDFQAIGMDVGHGNTTWDYYYYELYDDNVLVQSGNYFIEDEFFYLGFSGGGFDTVLLKNGEYSGQSIGDGSYNALAIDNVELSAVPIPAAVWLFGSGLGLLGWFRRRQTA